VIAGRDDLQAAYITALESELAASIVVPHEVDTLFIGGGTPTHLTAQNLQRLCALLHAWFPTAENYEWSVEANPRDITSKVAHLLQAQGVTRVSLGAQSFASGKLVMLERDHDAGIIRDAVGALRDSGLVVALDLIFGAPGESLSHWQDDLRQALALAPEHLSTYGLTFEKGTTFWGRLDKGELQTLPEELEREMYLAAIDMLTAAGYEHYEVSNFALVGQRCRHNENYWLGGEYFAAGPGAARYVAGRREMNHRSTTTWLARVTAGESPTAEFEELSPEDRARERLVFRLRRLEGLEIDAFACETGYRVEQLGGDALAQFIEQGLLAREDGRLRLTRRGLLVSDAMWPYFLRT
jgi:oxygen-independent coproporphyrinogen-3 oxidase